MDIGDISITVNTLNITELYIYIGEGNGNPLQWSCLENPGDGGLPSLGSHIVGHD